MRFPIKINNGKSSGSCSSDTGLCEVNNYSEELGLSPEERTRPSTLQEVLLTMNAINLNSTFTSVIMLMCLITYLLLMSITFCIRTLNYEASWVQPGEQMLNDLPSFVDGNK